MNMKTHGRSPFWRARPDRGGRAGVIATSGCLAVALALTILAGHGCHTAARTIGKHTYPPDFDYIDPGRLKSAMWVLAAEVRSLESLLAVPESDPFARQQAVLGILERIDGAAAQVAPGGDASNHPAMGRGMERFRARVERARRMAGRTPPSYFYAGEIAGACFICHGATRQARFPSTGRPSF